MLIRRIAAAVAVPLLATASLQASGEEPIKLRFSHFMPPVVFTHSEIIVPWTEEVKKLTNGRVEITVFPAGQLCKPPQQYECARDGLADFSFAVPGWTPNRFPMSSVLELPFMHRSAAAGSQMLADLWGEYLSKEYGDVVVLAMNTQPAGHIHTSSKTVVDRAGLKGLKMRVPTAVTGDLIELLGGAKVGLPIQDVYQATSQRTIDGFILNHAGLPGFRLHEVSKHHTEVGMYSVVFATFANKKRFESLPPDVRKVLVDTTSAASGYWRKMGGIWDANEVKARQLLVNQKHDIAVLPADERARWKEAARQLDNKWAEDLEKRGQPGRKLLEAARALSAKYGEAN